MIANLIEQFGEACSKLDPTINSCVKLDHWHFISIVQYVHGFHTSMTST